MKADTLLAVEIAMERLASVLPPDKVVAILFNPAERPDQHELYSNAAVAQLVPVLKAVLARLEAGDLRMPVAGGVQWVDEG